MDKSKRRAVIAGNWKMNKTATEAAALMEELVPAVADAGCDVVVCTPFTSLQCALDNAANTNIMVGAQNVHFEKSGAFTGEVSADMLVDLGVKYAIVGHSERRQYFGETDETVNRRARAAVDAGLVAIVCVGEQLAQREQGVTSELVRLQTKIALHGFSADDMEHVIIAYEPVWAIGTGRRAEAPQIREAHAFIHGELVRHLGEAGGEVPIQYGGSVTPENFEEILAIAHVDGGLVGGASLDPAKFLRLVAQAQV